MLSLTSIMAPKTSGDRGRQKKPRVAKNSAMAQVGVIPIPIPDLNNPFTVDTSKEDTTANLRQTTMMLAEKVLVIEERTTFLGDLLCIRRGTKEVEGFVRKQEGLRHETKDYVSDEDAVLL